MFLLIFQSKKMLTENWIDKCRSLITFCNYFHYWVMNHQKLVKWFSQTEKLPIEFPRWKADLFWRHWTRWITQLGVPFSLIILYSQSISIGESLANLAISCLFWQSIPSAEILWTHHDVFSDTGNVFTLRIETQNEFCVTLWLTSLGSLEWAKISNRNVCSGSVETRIDLLINYLFRF